jgi:hypothetical protein
MSLERHTVSQSGSAIDLRYREVMENLAQVSADRSTLPNFTTIFSGTAFVTDQGQLTAATTWPFSSTVKGGVGSFVGTPYLSRQVAENWELDPVLNPEQLEGMRAALQWAVGGGPQVLTPASYDLLINSSLAQPGPGRHFKVVDKLAHMPAGWLGMGKRTDMPRGACYSAHCGEHWVWVNPDGMQGLTILTLVIEDIARAPINSPTLFNLPTSPTPIVLKTLESKNANEKMGVSVQLVVDQNGRLYTDPFYPVRLNNNGSDPALRSIINAASVASTATH